MGRWLRILVGLGIIGAALGWGLTAPDTLPESAVAELQGDATRGERVFWAAGCASCHSAEGAEGDAKLVLTGGYSFVTDFGTFYAPNISPDPDQGIGGWTLAEFAQAVRLGVSPEGKHYYPAFPYTSYRLMSLEDVADLKAFMDTLPADATPSKTP